MCGEKCQVLGLMTLTWGSPPHVRGKEEFACRDGSQVGITPACAGKSSRLRSGMPVWEDHPRMCGEKLRLWIPYFQHFGITPACAGKSTSAPEMPDATGDHPRMCGEKPLCLSLVSIFPGSPPHVRGKAQTTKKLPGRCRITPACAGKR